MTDRQTREATIRVAKAERSRTNTVNDVLRRRATCIYYRRADLVCTASIAFWQLCRHNVFAVIQCTLCTLWTLAVPWSALCWTLLKYTGSLYVLITVITCGHFYCKSALIGDTWQHCEWLRSKFFTRSTGCRTRGNTMKLKKFHTLSARDGHFFSNRVVNVWNSLPDSVILSSTVASFKHKLQTLDLGLSSVWYTACDIIVSSIYWHFCSFSLYIFCVRAHVSGCS